MKQRTYSQHMKKQQGFTLLELLVVVSVLATLAGITAVAMDGYEQDAQEQLVNTEMKRIASAIYRFKEDTGYFPKEGVFKSDRLFSVGDERDRYERDENMGWLFISPENEAGDTVAPWNIHAAKGWNGPYLTNESQNRLSDTNCDLPAGVDITKSFIGLMDTFERNKTYTSTSVCLVVNASGNWIGRKFSGSPYQYDLAYKNNALTQCMDSGPGCLALVSAGENNKFDTDLTDNKSDDVVFVLRVNP